MFIRNLETKLAKRKVKLMSVIMGKSLVHRLCIYGQHTVVHPPKSGKCPQIGGENGQPST
jgi:hypothetical protein